jgi:uncharacterized membrane protein YagU involved in acid resistance
MSDYPEVLSHIWGKLVWNILINIVYVFGEDKLKQHVKG